MDTKFIFKYNQQLLYTVDVQLIKHWTINSKHCAVCGVCSQRPLFHCFGRCGV